MIKICAICGEEFETKHSSKVYCSAFCSKKGEQLRYLLKKNGGAQELPIKKCLICGEEFRPPVNQPGKLLCGAKECERAYHRGHERRRNAEEKEKYSNKDREITDTTRLLVSMYYNKDKLNALEIADELNRSEASVLEVFRQLGYKREGLRCAEKG